MDYHGRIMDLLPNAYFSKSDIRGDAAAIAAQADIELAELRLDRQRKDAEIARMREALTECIPALEVGLDAAGVIGTLGDGRPATIRDALKQARAALAPAAEVSGG